MARSSAPAPELDRVAGAGVASGCGVLAAFRAALPQPTSHTGAPPNVSSLTTCVPAPPRVRALGCSEAGAGCNADIIERMAAIRGATTRSCIVCCSPCARGGASSNPSGIKGADRSTCSGYSARCTTPRLRVEPGVKLGMIIPCCEHGGVEGAQGMREGCHTCALRPRLSTGGALWQQPPAAVALMMMMVLVTRRRLVRMQTAKGAGFCCQGWTHRQPFAVPRADLDRTCG